MTNIKTFWTFFGQHFWLALDFRSDRIWEMSESYTSRRHRDKRERVIESLCLKSKSSFKGACMFFFLDRWNLRSYKVRKSNLPQTDTRPPLKIGEISRIVCYSWNLFCKMLFLTSKCVKCNVKHCKGYLTSLDVTLWFIPPKLTIERGYLHGEGLILFVSKPYASWPIFVK